MSSRESSPPTPRFGTDGVRGVANSEITPQLAMAVGAATVDVFGGQRVLVARDTRRSGPMLEAALCAGIMSRGADAALLGVAPTPALAAVSAAEGVAGVVISASHNPFADNGLKVFAPGGHKLSDAEQDELESRIDQHLSGGLSSGSSVIGRDVGVTTTVSWRELYSRHVTDLLEGRTLDGLAVVLDCANGANSTIAGDVFTAAGASVEVIGDQPDGSNINDGVGSTDTEALQRAVLDRGAAVGIAFDGDADRVLAVDELGRVVTGDHLLAMLANDLRSRNRLRHDTVVITVMSNLGFRHAMQDAGIAIVETPVGDRHVLAALTEGGFSLGGEQSGHLILADHATTGDGLLAAVALADLLVRDGQPLSKLADAAMTQLPQVLVNVGIDRPMPDAAQRIASDIAEAEDRLGADGRVLVRPSGTEPVVRVMVEAADADLAAAVADRLSEAVARAD